MTTARELRLDYFRIYDIEDQRMDAKIATRGQFDASAKKAELQLRDLFGACTAKNKEPLFDPNAHFTWYRLLQPGTEATRMVTVRNQFGDSTVWLGKVEALLCPAQKIEKGSAFPEQLSHFKVYRVVDYGKSPDAAVRLQDQFGSEKTTVGVPLFFAVPVTKTVGERRFPILNPRAHLLIYRTPARPAADTPIASDQFGRSRLRLIRAVALAVPSLKLKWK